VLTDVVNHKPKQTSTERVSKISSNKGNDYTLTIEDDGDERPEKYTYRGHKSTAKRSFVLVFDPAKQSCSLEPLSATYNFNLTSTPWEQSASKLEKQYPQLQPHKDVKGENHDMIDEDGSEADDGGADNPYSYKNFLKKSASGAPKNVAATPVVEASHDKKPGPAASKTSLTGKQKTSTSRREDVKPKAKSAASSSSKPKPAPTPTVRLDRRASTRPTDPKPPPKKQRTPTASPPSSPDHADDLIIEGEDSPPQKPKKAIGLGLLDNASGPISFRSAANSASPSSRLHTPVHQSTNLNDDDVIDFGDDLGVDESDADADGEEDDMDADGDADVDVEPMDLGPPAHEAVQQNLQPVEEDDDEDDALAAEMLEELGESESEEE
jgi:hypothetical protein